MTPLFALGLLCAGLQKPVAGELPPLSQDALAWCGRYQSVEDKSVLSPRSDMELWLFPSGEYSWIRGESSGWWRRDGNRIVFFARRAFVLTSDFEQYQKGVAMFQAHEAADQEKCTFFWSMDRNGEGFKAASWPFNTFAVDWKKVPDDIPGVVSKAIEYEAKSESDAASDDDKFFGMEYFELTSMFSGAQVDQAVTKMDSLAADQREVAMMSNYFETVTPSLEALYQKWSLDQDSSRVVKLLALSRLCRIGGASSLEFASKSKSVPENRLAYYVLDGAVRLKAPGYLDAARASIDRDPENPSSKALEYLAMFESKDELARVRPLAKRDDSDAIWAKAVIIAKDPESKEATTYLKEIREKVKNLESHEQMGFDLSAAAKVLALYGDESDIKLLERYVDDQGIGFVVDFLPLVERLKAKSAVPYLKAHLGEMRIETGIKVNRLIQELVKN